MERYKIQENAKECSKWLRTWTAITEIHKKWRGINEVSKKVNLNKHNEQENGEEWEIWNTNTKSKNMKDNKKYEQKWAVKEMNKAIKKKKRNSIRKWRALK
jgi:predicted transglutaminase-like cysteine proteinase